MKYIFLSFLIFFSACSTKEYKHNLAKIIIIKSPKIKFSDLGYIRYSGNEVELELFMAGKVIQNISINHLICVSSGCMSKSSFNKNYLYTNYPDNLLKNILMGNKIYNGKNVKNINSGFTQHIETSNVDINYKVTNNYVFFKDKKNHIIFKIKNQLGDN